MLISLVMRRTRNDSVKALQSPLRPLAFVE